MTTVEDTSYNPMQRIVGSTSIHMTTEEDTSDMGHLKMNSPRIRVSTLTRTKYIVGIFKLEKRYKKSNVIHCNWLL